MRPFLPALGQCLLRYAFQLLDVADSRGNDNGDDCTGRNGATNGDAEAFLALFGWLRKDRLSGGKYCCKKLIQCKIIFDS